jgi:hypothetical protein
MSYWMSVVPLDQLPPGTWPKLTQPIASVIDNGDGTVALVEPGGVTVSCQPGGTIQTRAPGTDAAYERCILGANVVTYQPDTSQQPYQFAISQVPNG